MIVIEGELSLSEFHMEESTIYNMDPSMVVTFRDSCLISIQQIIQCTN